MRPGIRLIGTVALACAAVRAAAPQELDRGFAQTVRPFINTYCAGCHGGSRPAAQFDIRPYVSVADVVKDEPRWKQILERVDSKQMPPKGVKQPPDADRAHVVQWIEAMRAREARRNAGDPGVVLARRLSNAEYDYTIRDLTGVDLRPAREFPVDPANTEGFDNSGESLTMSPALLTKYLQSARDVANHMALTPDGLVFAPHTMLVETDREKFAIQRIVSFYERQPTDYAAYFEAAWRYRHRAALGTPNATLASVAKERGLSVKYLPMVWDILTDPKIDAAGPIAKLRAMWRALPAPSPAAVSGAVHSGCVAMRDWVARMRKDTGLEYAAPVVRGLSPTSQPLMNWKLRQFAAHRREFDPEALRSETDPPSAPPTATPRYAGLGQEAAVRAKALMLKSRASNPDLVVPAGERARSEAAYARFANVFPNAFYIRERGRFFPDDSEDKGRLLSAGYHNVMGFFRDDTPLIELILNDNGRKELDRLWEEFEYLADFTGRTWVQYYFNQSGEVQGKGRESGTARPSDKAVSASPVIFGLRDAYLAKAKANPDNDPVAIQAIEDHFKRVDDTLRGIERVRMESEPRHVDALLKFAERAYRRPLARSERDGIVGYYQSLREKSGLNHEEAIRDSMVSVLMSPHFTYRVDLLKGEKAGVQPLSPIALASRLSYFLWSSMPDEELLGHAESGDLAQTAVLRAQARRMLKDERARALAVEFGGNWLDFRRFEQHNAVDRERFQTFNNDLRESMFQEPIRLIEDVIRKNRSVLDLIYAKDTFVDPALAKHYGMPNVREWTHIEDASQYGRGGLLPMAVFLTQTSPGLRTSPVKRGFWVVRRIVGETIPPPPPNVPELPQDESKTNLPLREVLAKHRENAMCAACHARFDSFGLAFENYGPVGERRTADLAGRPVDTRVEFPGGKQGDGFASLVNYIHENREQDFVDNFSRKLLAYALNRSLQLSDEPLVETMRADHRFAALVEAVVTSSQFRNKR